MIRLVLKGTVLFVKLAVLVTLAILAGLVYVAAKAWQR
jgi:hypothetical protein